MYSHFPRDIPHTSKLNYKRTLSETPYRHTSQLMHIYMGSIIAAYVCIWTLEKLKSTCMHVVNTSIVTHRLVWGFCCRFSSRVCSYISLSDILHYNCVVHVVAHKRIDWCPHCNTCTCMHNRNTDKRIDKMTNRQTNRQTENPREPPPLPLHELQTTIP